MIRINVEELLCFHDSNPLVRRHANSVKTLSGEEIGLALFLNQLRDNGWTAEKLPQACTTQGNWLDGWVRASKDEKTMFYQVEVKTWSFHGYTGGVPLAARCSDAELGEYKIHEWNRYWDVHIDDFKPEKLRKVLLPMRNPPGTPVSPAACLWHAVHPEGKTDALFKVDLQQPRNGFTSIWIFSASSYLRNKLAHTPTIVLDLPNTAARLLALNRIFHAETV